MCPEDQGGSGGVENSPVGYTTDEAKQNWANFKAGIEPLIQKIGGDFTAAWNAIVAEIEKMIGKL